MDQRLPRWFRRLSMIDLSADHGEYSRASGQCVCEVCCREYWRHPTYHEEWQYLDHWPWVRDGGLTLLCDGTLVHL